MNALPVTVRVGVASPTSAVGATGRVSATPSVHSPSPSASSSSTPKPASSSSAAVVAATLAAPVPSPLGPDGATMLSAPLGLQATVLSQPSFYPALGEDLGDVTEEGDILFPVLGDPWSRVRSCSVVGGAESASAAASGGAACAGHLGGVEDLEAQTSASPSPSPAPAPAAAETGRSVDGAPRAVSAAAHPRALLVCSTVVASTNLCVQPVLTLPRRVGVSLAAEVFRALLCFHNAATYTLTQARFHVGVAQPPAPLRRALLRRTVPTIPAKSNYTIVAAVPLGDAGAYALAVAVDYNDPSGRQRQLSWNSTLRTEPPVMEAAPRQLTYMRPVALRSTHSAPSAATVTRSSASLSALRGSQDYARYQLTVGLKNMSSVPLLLTSWELQLPALTYHNGKPLFRNFTPLLKDAKAAPHSSNSSSNAAGRTSPLPGCSQEAAFLMPGDSQSLVFVVGVYLEELRHSTVVHGQGGVATRLLSPRLTSLGQVQWTWCRANGEGGTARSAPLRVEQLLAAADVDVFVLGVKPAVAAAGGAAQHSSQTPAVETAGAEVASSSSSSSPARTHPSHEAASPPLPPHQQQLLLAGSPITIDFTLVNHSAVHRYDVALKVRVERLAPQWLYTGPTVRLLGSLHPGSTLAFSLTLLPWQAGWLQVAQSALEVVDARMLEAVLWPPAAGTQLQPVHAHNNSFTTAATTSASAAAAGAGAMSGSEKEGERPTLVATLPAVAQTVMKAAAPVDGGVLCEVLVV